MSTAREINVLDAQVCPSMIIFTQIVYCLLYGIALCERDINV